MKRTTRQNKVLSLSEWQKRTIAGVMKAKVGRGKLAQRWRAGMIAGIQTVSQSGYARMQNNNHMMKRISEDIWRMHMENSPNEETDEHGQSYPA